MHIETAKKYNKRIEKAILSMYESGSTVAIIGKGRNLEEQSLVLVEKGNYLGYGFFDNSVSISDVESARTFVRKSAETPTVQNLINSYITNPRGAEIITFAN